LLYETDDGVVAALVRGDREINQAKLAGYLSVPEVVLARDETVRDLTGAAVGFAGPVGLPESVRVVADNSVLELTNFACGANKTDAHLTGVSWDRDLGRPDSVDLLLVTEGDLCPRCDHRLSLSRGIEVGHIFKLGAKYSEAMACSYTDEEGNERPMVMGCYGLGIGRTVAAAIEQNHDDNGIIWPLPLAPFEVLVAPLTDRDEAVVETAEGIYEELTRRGVDVLLDDRSERPGVKFKDADLVGIPVRVVIGSKSLADGKVELSLRRDGDKELVAAEGAVERVLELVAQ
jgi:prolyl-tRNA synthetase